MEIVITIIVTSFRFSGSTKLDFCPGGGAIAGMWSSGVDIAEDPAFDLSIELVDFAIVVYQRYAENHS